MGRPKKILKIPTDRQRLGLQLPTGLSRRKPRVYQEWKALKDWGKLPSWESIPPGYLLCEMRNGANLTQAEIAERLECSQQAIAQAERWEANPTTKFMQMWAAAVGRDLELRFRRTKHRRLLDRSSSLPGR